MTRLAKSLRADLERQWPDLDSIPEGRDVFSAYPIYYPPGERMTTTLIIPLRATSVNEIWEQRHWSKRSKLRNYWHNMVRAAIDPETVQLYQTPVHVTITACYKSRPVDADNVLCKPLVDALRGWYIRDDDPRYVASVRLMSRQSDSDQIVITLEPDS